MQLELTPEQVNSIFTIFNNPDNSEPTQNNLCLIIKNISTQSITQFANKKVKFDTFVGYLTQIKDRDEKIRIFNEIIEPLFFARPDLFIGDVLKSLEPIYANDVPEFKDLIHYGILKVDPTIFIGLTQIKDKNEKIRIFKKIIEPLFFKEPNLFTKDVLKSLRPVYANDVPEFKYLLFYVNLKKAKPSIYDPSLFPYQAVFRGLMSKGNRKVLVMHNINDGQGDELIRNSTLIQALLDFNPKLEVVIYSNRGYLYGRGKNTDGKIISSHKRIEIRNIYDYNLNTNEKFDMIIHYYNKEYSYNNEIETNFQQYLNNNPPPKVYLNADKFMFKEIVLDNQKFPFVIQDSNAYIPTYRLCAELGIPFRFGIQEPKESLLTDLPYQVAKDYWNQSVKSVNIENRPVAIINGFGGTYENKGYDRSESGQANFTQTLREIINNKFFVIVLPNHKDWGTEKIAQKRISKLSPEEQKYIITAPSPQENPFLHKYLLNYADIIVTVEGGLMHLAYNMGKPFRTLFMIGSGSFRYWFPVGAGLSQNVGEPEIKQEDIGKLSMSDSPVARKTDIMDLTNTTESGGIDLSQIELTLKDDKYVSSLNPADLKILRAAKALKDDWESLSLLYIHEIMLLLKDGMVKQIQNKEILSGILKALQLKEFLDPQAIQFLHLIQSQKPLDKINMK